MFFYNAASMLYTNQSLTPTHSKVSKHISKQA